MSALLTTTLPHRTVALFVLWLLLSQSYSLIHMAIGFAAALGVAWLNSSKLPPSSHRVRWPQLIAYIPWLFWRILASGAHLCYLILHPRLPIAPTMIRHRTELPNESALVILGNSLTLTPGTITVEASSEELVVHAMDDESALDFTSLRFENKVANLFERREVRR